MKPNTAQEAVARIKALHAAYEARTGYKITWNLSRENTWMAWLTFCSWSWGETELARVIGYLRIKISKGERNEGALKFNNLIGNADTFEEDLNLALEAAKGSPSRPRSKPSATAPQATTEADTTPGDSSHFMRALKQS